MIAKRILSPKGGAGFQRLGAYVLNVQDRHRSADPARWERLNAYILDAEHEGEKVAWARVTNCASTDAGWAVKEIIATQGRNTRSRRDRSYHLVASFSEGERPTREQIEDIEDRLCEAIGLAEHQRVSAVHQNTDHWHLHVAISTVHPATFRNVSPFRDHWRLQETCAELELKHGLTVTNHTLQHEAGQPREPRVRPESFLAWVKQEAAAALLEARDAGQGWEHLHGVAADHGLTLKLRGAGLVIGHAKDQRLHVKASDVDRGLSLKALNDALGGFEPAVPAAHAQPGRTSYTRPGQQGALYAAYAQERAAATRAQATAALALREQPPGLRRRVGRLLPEPHEGGAGERPARHPAPRQHSARRPQAARGSGGTYRARDGGAPASPRGIPPTWQGWLEARAAEGSAEALAILSTMRRATTPATYERQHRNVSHAQERQRSTGGREKAATRERGQATQNDVEHER